jgi:small subunit ribosomal protein S9
LSEEPEERREAEQPEGEEAIEAPAETAETSAAAAEDSADAAEAPAGEGGESLEAPPAESTEAPAESAEAPAAEGAEVAAETPEADEVAGDEAPESVAEEPQPPQPVDLGPEARYSATGKRKSSVARVIVRPGSGAFDLNGRSIDAYFPRPKHRAVVRQPLEVSGYLERVDIRARIHGGGVSGQADALRHGIAKALIEADPQLRGDLKRRQLLTRDPRVKERRKAGLKKARKRPQFSKR